MLSSNAWAVSRYGPAELLIDSRWPLPAATWRRARVSRAPRGSAFYGRKEVGFDIPARQHRRGQPVRHYAVRYRHVERIGALRQARRAQAPPLLDAVLPHSL